MKTLTQATVETNSAWFNENDGYIENQSKLTVYKNIKLVVEHEIRGVRNLLDVGNGGFFNFDTSLVDHCTAVDLFLAEGPGPTPNSTFRKGSFMDLPCPSDEYDCVMQQNVLHHVTGRTVAENHANMKQCLREMYRVTAPGGMALVIESTVNFAFNLFEKVVYRPLLYMKRGGHPVTYQFTPSQIVRAAEAAGFKVEELTYVPRGMFLLQFGVVWPSLLTPAQPIKLVLRKP